MDFFHDSPPFLVRVLAFPNPDKARVNNSKYEVPLLQRSTAQSNTGPANGRSVDSFHDAGDPTHG
jgi:hypothetical protein